jgi:hypothetical protein
MTGWDEHGHARPTGLPIDRYLGSGDLQDAEDCGYAPVSVLAEMGIDYSHGDSQIQYRDGRIVLTKPRRSANPSTRSVGPMRSLTAPSRRSCVSAAMCWTLRLSPTSAGDNHVTAPLRRARHRWRHRDEHRTVHGR